MRYYVGSLGVRVVCCLAFALAACGGTGASGGDDIGVVNQDSLPAPNINGKLETVSSPGGVVTGWTADANNSSLSISAHLYLDNPYPRGVFVTGGSANVSRPDVDAAYGISGNHGFSFTLPNWLHDGQMHTLYAYGVNDATTNTGLLNGSPLSFQLPATSTTCNATDLASLKTCVQNIASYDRISLLADVTCTGAACCGPSNTAFIAITGQQNKTIDGNFHKLTRSDNQTVCSFMSLTSDSNIVVKNLTIDEDAADPPCAPTAACARTFDLNNAHHSTFSRVQIYNAKGYAVYVWSTDYFSFTDSYIVNAGIIGIYASGIPNGLSHSININSSNFLGIRTNALALEGVSGTDTAKNLITRNVFSNNHNFGLWTYSWGGVQSGGQVFLHQADHVLLQSNTIMNGFCTNCVDHLVEGVEIGGKDMPGALNNAQIDENVIDNNNGPAIFLDSSIDSTVQFTANNFLNNGNANGSGGGGGISMDVGVTDGSTKPVANIITPTVKFDLFETASGYGSDWTQWNLCSPGSSIDRWCPGSSDAMEGSCVLRLRTQPFTCTDLAGVWTQGMAAPIGPNRNIYLNTWSRNSSWTGQSCLVFLNASYAPIGYSCQDQHLDAGKYDADPIVAAVTPAGTAYFQVKLGAMSASGEVDIDMLRVAY